METPFLRADPTVALAHKWYPKIHYYPNESHHKVFFFPPDNPKMHVERKHCLYLRQQVSSAPAHLTNIGAIQTTLFTSIYIINHNYMLITYHKMIPKNMWIPYNHAPFFSQIG